MTMCSESVKMLCFAEAALQEDHASHKCLTSSITRGCMTVAALVLEVGVL